MGYIVECENENCQTKFEITVLDHLVKNGEPDIFYCPNCGKKTLIDA